jgi:protein associated with RNAse G/E
MRRMAETLIGHETPIHITKYDGSYHRRWPGRLVERARPLFVLRYEIGDVISAARLIEDDPAAWAIRWPGEVYLWDDRWYNVSRSLRDGRAWYYANIASPVRFEGGEFHCIDLDLDVSWYPGEQPRVLDEDEFLAHAESMRYPAPIIERARAAVDEVLGLIGQRAFPFDRA